MQDEKVKDAKEKTFNENVNERVPETQEEDMFKRIIIPGKKRVSKSAVLNKQVRDQKVKQHRRDRNKQAKKSRRVNRRRGRK